MTDPGAAPRPDARVIRLHSIRTLVIARDLAFRQRAMTVLADVGVVAFAIAGADSREQVHALLADERPDVVVLDATGCTQAISGLVYELYERAPRMGVVLVSSTGDDERLGLPTLPKWGWAADLSHAVQEAYHHGNPLSEETTLHAQ
ncbi:MAG TPA: hypothetical protein VNT54_07910 [Solirubrobacteraceae bacterium]|nr:hypothetical protein [Solirubrobacteraceae bacterium]